MEDINRVTIVGRAAQDADLRYTNGGTAICKVPVAINRRKKVGDEWTDEASYIKVQIWGKTAEGLAPKLTKGTQFAVDGQLRQDRWEQDGESRSEIVVVASVVELLGKKREEQNNGW